jgi:hypothetical protein
MTNQENLTESLGLAFEHIRALHATIAAVMTDVAALRHVVTRDHKVSRRRYRRELATAVAKVKPLVTAAMNAYEEEIARIKSNSRWKN